MDTETWTDEKPPRGFKLRGKYWQFEDTSGAKRRRISTRHRDLNLAILCVASGAVWARARQYQRAKLDSLRLLDSARARARLSREPFRLTEDDLERLWLRSRGRCELTGIAFNDSRGGVCRRAPLKPSLDRIRRGDGYTPENVRLVCVAINTAINEWGESIFEFIATEYLRYQRLKLRTDAKTGQDAF